MNINKNLKLKKSFKRNMTEQRKRVKKRLKYGESRKQERMKRIEGERGK